MSETPVAIEYESPATSTHVSAVAVGTIGLALIGLKLLVDVLMNLPFAVQLWMQPAASGLPQGYLFGSTAYAGVGLLAGTALLVFARQIAKRLFGKLSDAPLSLGPTAWMTILVSAIGLSFALFSAELAINGVIAIVARLQANVVARVPTPIEAGELLRLVIHPVELLVGLAIFLRPRWVVGVWGRHARF